MSLSESQMRSIICRYMDSQAGCWRQLALNLWVIRRSKSWLWVCESKSCWTIGCESRLRSVTSAASCLFTWMTPTYHKSIPSLHLHLIWHTGIFFTSLVSNMCNKTHLDDSHLPQIHPLSLHLHHFWHTGLFFTSLVSTMCNETHLDESLSIDLLSSLSSIICLNQRVLGLYFTVSLQIQYVDLVNSSWRCPTDSTVLSQNPLLYNFNKKYFTDFHFTSQVPQPTCYWQLGNLTTISQSEWRFPKIPHILKQSLRNPGQCQPLRWPLFSVLSIKDY